MWNHPTVRFTLKLVIDTALAALAWGAALLALGPQPRFEVALHCVQWTCTALLVNLLFQLPRQHFRLFARRDFFRLILANSTIVILALGLSILEEGAISATRPGTIMFAGMFTGLFWTVVRMGLAEWHEVRGTSEQVNHAPAGEVERVIIVGAGRAGLLIQQELHRHPELAQKVVGFVDDALEKQAIRINGLPVLGTRELLPTLLEQHQISLVILAIPTAPGPVIRQYTRLITQAGVRIKTVPGIFNLLGSQSWAPVVKDVAIEDLLRREPVQLDQSALSQVLDDSVVLITGGGGSIGSELARQVAAFHPSRIVLLGRGENSLWEAERNIRYLFPNQTLSLELCDIRDPTRLRQAFEKWKPETVLHAAAHKHVPYLEMHPSEAVLNNVLGTRNVVRAAQMSGVHTFVNISTDKAVNPANVLGASKFLAECILLDAAASAFPHQRFVSVRFGNVLGSRGSVIPIFKSQICHGGPITVTHPDMTRYFMTIPEASQLVLQAGILGSNGKVYVLDMGEPVRIRDLAEDMARLSGLTVGRDIEIQFTGIRPGEKLFEETFMAQEERHSGVHPKVFEGARTPLDAAFLRRELESLNALVGLPEGKRQRALLAWLKRMVPTYQPSPTGLGRYDQDSQDRRVAGALPRPSSTRA